MKSNSTSIGTAEHVAIAIAYALGWLSGLVILLVEKSNTEVRYHAAQSIIVFGGFTALNLVVSMVPLWGISLLLLNVLNIAVIVAWIVFVVTALNKKPLVIAAIGDYVKQLQTLVKA